jgi:hypothetical protein
LSNVGSGSKSASSIAGKISLIAAAVVSGCCAAGEVGRHAHANFRLRDRLGPALERHPAAGEYERALHQKPDEGSGETEPFQYRRRAQTHLPAKRLLARDDARPALGKLRRQAFFDERVVEIAQRECHLWLSGCTS